MDLLIQLLTDPKIWSIITPAGIVVATLAFVIYKMFLRYDRLQEQRIAENKQMIEEYTKLAQDITKTLDVLLQVIGQNGLKGK